MRKLRLIFTLIATLTLIFASTICVFAKTTDKSDYHNWKFSLPGETVELEGCESVEDEAKDWEYVKGTEHFYDASITVMDYFVDSNGDGTTTYEIIAHLDNSKHDTKKYNTHGTVLMVLSILIHSMMLETILITKLNTPKRNQNQIAKV